MSDDKTRREAWRAYTRGELAGIGFGLAQGVLAGWAFPRELALVIALIGITLTFSMTWLLRPSWVKDSGRNR